MKKDNISQISERKTISQIKKYIEHRRLFNIGRNPSLKLFENLLYDSRDYKLECSIKFDGEEVYPCRFNILYNGKQHVRNINLVFDFLNELSSKGAKINYDLIKKIFTRDIDLRKINHIFVGIDLRSNIAYSRAKVWLDIDKDYYQLFNKVLNLHGYNEDVSKLIVPNNLLFGFDFSFIGKTRIKIYPYYNQSALKNVIILNRLRNIFSPKIFELIQNCKRMSVSFESYQFKKVIHFIRPRFDFFLVLINSKKFNKLCGDVEFIKNIKIISLKEGEVNRNNIKVVNIYY